MVAARQATVVAIEVREEALEMVMEVVTASVARLAVVMAKVSAAGVPTEQEVARTAAADDPAALQDCWC